MRSGALRMIVGSALALLVLVAPGIGSAAARSSTAPKPARATADPGPPVITLVHPTTVTKLPSSFFGLSIEYTELPMYERFLPAFERVLGLLKVAGDGPQALRVGGDSADLTFWDPGPQPLPRGAYVLSDHWFSQLATLIGQAGLQMIVDLNLRNGTPSGSASLAREALRRFPRHSIIGFEIGNEPEGYRHGYSPRDYEKAFRAYARALAVFAPEVPLLGPATRSFSWYQDVLRAVHALLGVPDEHRYLLNNCAPPGSSGYPTVAKLLDPGLTTEFAQSVKQAVRLAHRARRKFRLGELNSVTCTGTPGVSNTFATALWAPNALFSLLASGLDALNVHIRPTTINGPLVISSHGFVARPLLYGLALFARTLSPDGQLLRLEANVPHFPRLRLWAVRVRGGAIHLLLVNLGTSRATVKVRLPPAKLVTLERMLGPSATATGGVTLAGQRLDHDGTLAGRLVSHRLRLRSGGYKLTVTGESAALVSAELRIR